MTTTTATTHQRHATIAHEWLLKSVEIILSSRRGGNSNATPSTVGKTDKKKKKKIKKKTQTRSWWFNLQPYADKNEEVECNGLDEEEGERDDGDGGDEDVFAFDSIRKQLEPWRLNDTELGFNPTPLVVDIFHCHEKDEKEQKQEKENEEAFLVERWVLSVDPLIASDASCASKPYHETSIMYKKAVIQTRVLISLLRSLPAHRLQRRARLQLRADAGKMFHKIYATTTTTSDFKPKNINGENFVWRTFMFSKIDTKVGSMHARCFFLDEYSLNESRKVPGMSRRYGSATSSSSLAAAAAALAVTADVSVSPHKIEERKDVQQQKTKVKGLLTTELAKCEKNLSKGDGAIAVDTSQKRKPSKNFVPVNASSAPSNLFDAIRPRTETRAADVPGTSAALLPSMKASSFGRESQNFNFQQFLSPYGSPAVRLEPPEQARTLVVSPRIATFSSNAGGKTSIAQENENEDDLFALDEDVSQATSFEKTKNTDMEIGALVRMLKDAPGLCPLDSSDTFGDAQERLEAFKGKMKNSSSSAEEEER